MESELGIYLVGLAVVVFLCRWMLERRAVASVDWLSLATALGRGIEKYTPMFFEDPLRPNSFDAMAQVAEELGERPGMKQMGMVMKAATALAAGKADGSRLSKAVKDRL